MNIVLDTNVIVAAMRSRHGASNLLLQLLGERDWQANLSVPLLLVGFQAPASSNPSKLGLGAPGSQRLRWEPANKQGIAHESLS